MATVRRASIPVLLPFLVALSSGLRAQTIDPPAYSVPPLVRVMEIRSIAYWGDEIVVETDRSGINYRNEIASRPWFWRLDPVARKLTRLDPEGGRRLVGISSGLGSRLAVALRGDQLDLLAFDASSPAGRQLCSLGKSPQLQQMSVVPFGRFVCVVDSEGITVVADREVIGRIPLTQILGPDGPLLRRISPRAVAATKQEIFLGFDAGEFGGGAYAFSLTENGRLRNPRKVWSEHVSAIAVQPDDVVWMAGGVSHLGMIVGSLVREQAGRLEIVVHQARTMGRESQTTSSPIVRLPEASTIDGVALDADGGVLIAATQLGLVGYTSGRQIRMLWAHPLRPTDRDENRTYEGQPVGLVRRGDSLFLATRFLGVMEFARTPEGFRFRGQITIPTD